MDKRESAVDEVVSRYREAIIDTPGVVDVEPELDGDLQYQIIVAVREAADVERVQHLVPPRLEGYEVVIEGPQSPYYNLMIANMAGQAVIAHHKAELLKIPGVIGVGLGANPSDTSELVIYVDVKDKKDEDRVRRAVPSRLEGHPVIVEGPPSDVHLF